MVFNPGAKTLSDKRQPLCLLGTGLCLYIEFAICLISLPFYLFEKICPPTPFAPPSTTMRSSVSALPTPTLVAPVRSAPREIPVRETSFTAALRVREAVLQEIRLSVATPAPPIIAALATPTVAAIVTPPTFAALAARKVVSPACPPNTNPTVVAPAAPPVKMAVSPACLPNATPTVAPAVPTIRRGFRGVSTRVTRLTVTLGRQEESRQDRRRRLAQTYCRQ